MKQVYDSAIPTDRLRDMVRSLIERRDLVRLLTRREITVRYHRSFLGVWWVLLSPSLTVLTWWLVFSNILRFSAGQLGIPYVVYLVAGITVSTFATQTITLVGGSLVWNENILAKIHIQPEILAFSSALATSVNVGILLIPMFALQLLMGVGIPGTALLVPVVLGLVFLFSVGVGLVIAAMASRFPDTLNILAFLLQLLTFLAPTFYPISIIPKQYIPLFHLNPLFHFLELFRSVAYGGSYGPADSWIVAVSVTAGFLLIGVRVFARAARRSVVKA